MINPNALPLNYPETLRTVYMHIILDMKHSCPCSHTQEELEEALNILSGSTQPIDLQTLLDMAKESVLRKKAMQEREELDKHIQNAIQKGIQIRL